MVLLVFYIKCQQKDVLGDSAIVTAGMQTGYTWKMLTLFHIQRPQKAWKSVQHGLSSGEAP